MARSPFPGMDPYLESQWGDVHVKLLAFLGETLQASLPADLLARSEAQLLVEEDDGEDRTIRPDVTVVQWRPETDKAKTGLSDGDGGTAVAVEPPATRIEPVTVRLFDMPRLDRWLQVLDRTNGHRVVTVVQVLSPWNKFPGRGNDKYRQKILSFIQAGVNVVEIDLLRLQRDELPVPETYVPASRREAYYTSVSKIDGEADWAVYPMSLRKPLPPIPVPLRAQDEDVWIELQPLIDRTYAAGGYVATDYAKSPKPPLAEADAAWADTLLKAAGRR